MSFLTLGQRLGDPKCPYLRRWVLNLGLFSIRLHHWRRGDDPRHHHDHGWDFVVWVLKGSYIDVTPDGEEQMTIGTIRFRRAEHRHTVRTNGCWTLLLCGPERRSWGFFINRKTGHEYWVKASRYFRKKGHHPCQSS